MSIGVSIGALNEAVSVISEGFTVTPVDGSGHFIDDVALFVLRSTLLSLLRTKYSNNACVSVRVCMRAYQYVRVYSLRVHYSYSNVTTFIKMIFMLTVTLLHFFSTHDASNDLKEFQQRLLKFLSKHIIRPSFRMHPPMHTRQVSFPTYDIPCYYM